MSPKKPAPWDVTDVQVCERDRSARILLDLGENVANIDLNTAASLATLCVDSVPAVSCDDRDFSETNNCYRDVSTGTEGTPCGAFHRYISGRD